MDKLDNWAEDKRAGLKADLKDLDEQVKALKKETRQTGNLPDKLALQRKVRTLEQKRDAAWREYDAAAGTSRSRRTPFSTRWRLACNSRYRTKSCSPFDLAYSKGTRLCRNPKRWS